ncbi:hypothetical protein [Nocardioides gilvus]|uniref:hypothetical protein n=1 Tax=Nocardioides gilvus TaxID=1735589 RepID=UPI0013A5312F|nr:hypothetical protein [Nocardioides gilvus]
MGPTPTRRRKLLLHVGTPKTGTSHLQDVLFRNRAVLATQGLHYPGERFDSHFRAAIDLMGLHWAGLGEESAGAWDELAAEVRNARGTSIISHEVLAAAKPAQVRRALESLGDMEVHLIISARDLVRQIPAEWQENVKHNSSVSFANFLERIQDPERGSRVASWFWRVQDLPDIIERWGAGLPPEQIHLITVPPRGAPRDELWSRFSRVFGLDGLWGLDLAAARANPSMGVAETTLVRKINRKVRGQLPGHYGALVRELLVHKTLSHRSDSPRISLPPEWEQRAMKISAGWVEELGSRGYDLVGDLDDLRGHPGGGDWVDPDRPGAKALNRVALDVIEALLNETARLRDVEQDLKAQLEASRGGRPKVDDLLRTPVGRRLLGSRAGAAALRRYRRRRAEGENSLPA